MDYLHVAEEHLHRIVNNGKQLLLLLYAHHLLTGCLSPTI